MASEFSKRKLRTFFRRLDANNDGYLTKEDFELIADRSCEDQSSGSIRRETVREHYVKFFELFCALGNKEEKLNEEGWIEAGMKLRNDPQFLETLEVAIKTIFDLMDTNGDGYIQEDEYIKFLYYTGVHDHEKLAKIAFEGMDTNRDGVLSADEFRAAALDFWTSEVETSPGTNLLGPLI